jgi:nucleoside-diphosphate-sugar epimerase
MTLAGRRVLVTGGTGFIGGRLIEKLILDHKAQVRVLVRNFSRASRVARFDLQMVGGNITDGVAVDQAVDGCDMVFHCAYDFAGGRRQRGRVNVGGTENVAQAALRHGARMIHVSSADVYGWPAAGRLDETTPRRPQGNIYAESKLAAERLVLDYHQRHNLPVTVVQPTIVYGPFSRPWTIRPIQQLKTGKVVLVDEGLGCCNAVYVDDVVDGLLLAATQERAVGETILISGEEPIAWRDFYGRYEKVLGMDATVYMSVEEVRELLRKQVRDNSTWRQLVQFFREPRVVARIQRMPAARNTYGLLHRLLPSYAVRLRDSWRLDSSPTAPTRAKHDTGDLKLHLPDPWRMRLYRSRSHVRIDKAQELLGYHPAFDFERGMALTEVFLRWASLV